MSNRQIAAMIARRRAAKSKAEMNTPDKQKNSLLTACIEAAGYSEHRHY